jgi:hypothetical protein
MQITDAKESSRIAVPVRVMHLARERKWPGYGPASRSPVLLRPYTPWNTTANSSSRASIDS